MWNITEQLEGRGCSVHLVDNIPKDEIRNIKWDELDTKSPVVFVSLWEAPAKEHLAIPDDLPYQVFLVTGNYDDVSNARCVVIPTASNFFSRHHRFYVPARLSRHFVCLNRCDRPSRRKIADELHRSGLSELGVISYLQRYSSSFWEGYRELDGDINVVASGGYPAPFTDHAFSIVTESCNQFDDTTWMARFVTEKSVKSLDRPALFWTMPGHVKLLRSLGFDVFDDIIDHSYDEIIDYELRFDTLFSEARRLCRIPLANWQSVFDAPSFGDRRNANDMRIRSIPQEDTARILETVFKRAA